MTSYLIVSSLIDDWGKSKENIKDFLDGKLGENVLSMIMYFVIGDLDKL